MTSLAVSVCRTPMALWSSHASPVVSVAPLTRFSPCGELFNAEKAVTVGATPSTVSPEPNLTNTCISDEVPLYFRSVPAVATYIEYSTDDLINTCWYANKITGREILIEYPDYNGKQRENLMSNPNETYTVNYGQIKQSDRSFYIYSFLDDDPMVPLMEAQRSYPQIIIYRDRVRPGEAEGRGIALDLMPSIEDLNKIMQYRTKNMAFKANPPMFYDAEEFFNPYSVRQWSGALIPRRAGGRNPLEALEMPEYPDVMEAIRDLREFVQKGFQVDPLGEIDSPVKSATEISIRENRAQRTSSTDISRLINEQPKQIWEVAATALNERGLLVKKRQQIPGFDPKKLKFNFQSPLYDIENQNQLNAFVQNCQIKQQFYGEQAIVVSTNLGAVSDFLTEKLNLPSKLFKTGPEIMKALDAIAQQAKEAQQQAAAVPPSPTTTAGQVNFPQQQGVTI